MGSLLSPTVLFFKLKVITRRKVYHPNHMNVSIILLKGMVLKLETIVYTVSFVIPSFVYPRKSIWKRYPYCPNNHKLEGAVLVEEDEKVVTQNTAAISVYILWHHDFLDNQLYAENNISVSVKRFHWKPSLWPLFPEPQVGVKDHVHQSTRNS